MAKVVNTFVKGKLNKDLDARLVPNGEYRDAKNVQVSKSEGPDVGELENVLGNKITSLTWSSPTKCIGWITDESNNFVYLFLTDNTTSNYKKTPSGSYINRIVQYNVVTDTAIDLILPALGEYLNFSQLFPIYGINIVENLLFWTDNRNQPRKINIDKAVASDRYYQTEDQISVAKYNPYQAIELFKPSVTTGAAAGSYETTMKDVTSKITPIGFTATAPGASAGSSITITPSTAKGINPVNGQSVGYIAPNTTSIVDTGVTVSSYSSPIIQCSGPPNTPIGAEIIIDANPYYDNLFAGDPAFLEDKFVRFSYRWRFDDNEYSIMAPFTQAAFIPKQDGYFMYVRQEAPAIDKDDQAAAYRSTIVDFMENKVDDIELIFPLPYDKFKLQDELKVKELEILYKESDGLSVQVIDTIPIGDIYNSSARCQLGSAVTAATTLPITNLVGEIKVGEFVTGNGITGTPKVVSYASGSLVVDIAQTLSNSTYLYIGNALSFSYNYVSKKPFKTLPSDELTRVFDKTPVRAFSQEVSGNRVIYANYENKHTPPEFIDYNVAVSPKSVFEVSDGTAKVNGNQTLAASPGPYLLNIDTWSGASNIDVGDAILNSSGFFLAYVKSVPAANTQVELDRRPSGNLGVSSSFKDNDVLTFTDPGNVNDRTSKVEYPNSTLKQNRNYQVGIVLSDRYGRQSSVILSNNKTKTTVGDSTFIGDTVYSSYNNNSINRKTWPGDSLKVLFNNPIPGGITGLYNGDTSSSDYNPLGWYSYKIVVKQTEQEYYNVYLPGIMASYPNDFSLELGSTSHVVLINDNINKVPRDLSEVGPDQKQYRSSVRLFGRVQNTTENISYITNAWGIVADDLGKANIQYYPGRTADTVSTISTMVDLFDYDLVDPPKPNYFPQLYLYESNPLIARISTEDQIGQIATTNYAPSSGESNIAVTSPVSQNIAINFPVAAPLTGDLNGFLIIAASVPDNVFVSNYTKTGTNTGTIDTVDVDGNSFRITLELNEPIVFEPAFTGAGGLGVLKNPGIQYLAVYETTPVISNLDIFWETTSTGLISDLNTFILNETIGGANINAFDTSAWTEGLASGGNILQTAFKVVDQFGVNLDPANYDLIEVTFDSSQPITDGNGTNVSGYFEQPSGNQTSGWNIATTTNYYNNIFYFNEDNAAARLFNFPLKIRTIETATGNESVVYKTVLNQGPQNESPTISGGITIETTRYNTGALTTIVGTNGATNPNLRYLDLTATIASITKNSVALSNEGVEAFSNFFTISTSIVSNNLQTQLFFANSNIDVADYVVTINYSDAAQTVNSSYTIALNEIGALASSNAIQPVNFFCDGNVPGNPPEATFLQIRIDNAANSSNNGYYLYKGPVSQSSSNNAFAALVNNTNVITIDKTNAATSSSINCPMEFFFTAGVGGQTDAENFNDLRLLAKNSDCLQNVFSECEDQNGDSQAGYPSACSVGNVPCANFGGLGAAIDITGYSLEII